MVTFAVEDVAPPAEDRFRTFIDGRQQALQLGQGASVEAFSNVDTQFLSTGHVPTKNGLLAAVHKAFNDHLDLAISPDVIWITIMQGMSAHVASDPEKFRNAFVSHSGQKELVVRDDSLVKGSWNNKWKAVIEGFSEQIASNLNGAVPKSTLGVAFTTTLDNEKVAHIMTFMDCVKSYFRYTVMTKCGIRNIELLGTRDDWVKLSSALDILDTLELSAWKKQLSSILEHFVNAFDGNIDREFWAGIYRKSGGRGSGSIAKVSGWITKLFLYTANGLNNSALQTRNAPEDPAKFPSGLSSTPFKWEYLKETYKMHFNAGIIGVTMPDNNKLKPELGWFVSEV